MPVRIRESLKKKKVLDLTKQKYLKQKLSFALKKQGLVIY